jgi:hypothetical protein
MSISGDNDYHKRLRARIREFHDIEASRNSPELILDSPSRRGHIQHGTNAYSNEPIVEGGKKKKGLAKTLKTIGQFVKPVAQPILEAATRRAVQEIGGRAYKKKKTGFAKFARDVGNFIKPVAKPILQAATNRAVREIDTYGGGPREDWQAEVKKMRDEHGCSLREALSLASKARHERNGTKPKPKVVRTEAQKARTKANRAAKKAAALFEELPQGGRRR